MFAIYTPNGRSFSGPLEELYRVQQTQTSEKTRNFQETDEFSPVFTKSYNPKPKVINNYKESISKSNQKEIICHAYQVMTTPVYVVQSTDLLTSVINKFADLPFQEFPIVNSQQQLIGILTRQQVYEYIIKHGADSSSFKNRNINNLFVDHNTKVYTSEPITDIRRIASLQVNNHLHTIPILENSGKIVGIISRTDIIKAVVMDPPLSLWC
jgi:CBS-domain-containing membrane protein